MIVLTDVLYVTSMLMLQLNLPNSNDLSSPQVEIPMSKISLTESDNINYV